MGAQRMHRSIPKLDLTPLTMLPSIPNENNKQGDEASGDDKVGEQIDQGSEELRSNLKRMLGIRNMANDSPLLDNMVSKSVDYLNGNISKFPSSCIMQEKENIALFIDFCLERNLQKGEKDNNEMHKTPVVSRSLLRDIITKYKKCLMKAKLESPQLILEKYDMIYDETCKYLGKVLDYEDGLYKIFDEETGLIKNKTQEEIERCERIEVTTHSRSRPAPHGLT